MSAVAFTFAVCGWLYAAYTYWRLHMKSRAMDFVLEALEQVATDLAKELEKKQP
jgi:hypothetical protein